MPSSLTPATISRPLRTRRRNSAPQRTIRFARCACAPRCDRRSNPRRWARSLWRTPSVPSAGRWRRRRNRDWRDKGTNRAETPRARRNKTDKSRKAANRESRVRSGSNRRGHRRPPLVHVRRARRDHRGGGMHVEILGAMTQAMIHQHQGQHGLGDGRGADADAGIVAAGGDHLDRLALHIHAAAGQSQTRRRLQRQARDAVLPRRNAAQYAAGVIAQETQRRDLVAGLRALLFHTGETRANFDALDRVDAHQSLGDVGIEPIEHRFAPARRHAGGDYIDARAAGVALFAQRIHVDFQVRDLVGNGAEENVIVDLIPVEGVQIGADGPELGEIAADLDAVAFAQIFLGDGPRRHPHRGFARRRTTAAAIITQTVFLLIGVVGVTGAELLGDLAVILGALIDIVDDEANRRASGLALEHAGQNSYFVGLAPLGGVARCAGLAAVEFALDVARRELHAGRAAVDGGAERQSVTLAESGDAEESTEGVSRHSALL